MRKDIKRIITEEVDNKANQLIRLSTQIHNDPEQAWEEHRASMLTGDILLENGFAVERGICGLATAFKARYGNGKPAIAFIAEYDALPEIGHGCGHNIIAAAAVGAGIASRKIVDLCGGSVLVMGCPAEEKLGGKVIMMKNGAFNGIDAALMVHPIAGGRNWAGFRSTASISIEVDFWGRESHAAANPWDGMSALEGLILAFNNINSARLHFKERGRINGIIVDGGRSPNTIPEHGAGVFILRASDDEYLEDLKRIAIRCFEGAAKASETRVEYRWGMQCAVMQNSPILAELWKKNMRSLGLEVEESVENSASTDMGNVSRVIPSMHSFVSISSKSIAFHSCEFTEAAGSEEAQKATLNGAKALAMTASDIFDDPKILLKLEEM